MNGIAGFGSVNPPLGSSEPRSTINTALINPAMPAAPSRWPIFGLMLPIIRGPDPGLLRPKTMPKACASILSPNDVPVPWAST
ncbi:Uncharacterised protein [Mycobacterium tuberculosis]|uniref:Uncharacterized protein n=1 Tax=Mycobacterium tuberculosis TaxID=1773 RepID=A0A0U0RV36_MYCTX|nr:Uncharacterised protein [Mycobacterium tuberculosis]COV75592.1 Uncharacterised protein [Mycobacterium tuberculosis]COW30989.1 Uncharacterised protein [Mycobacterium tuberculosis]COW75650.1 Uncharacterised protein [Mycobacterium tuberculosis]COW87672.1 Uncharacterised protein [Mycobacterium tuberculosis]